MAKILKNNLALLAAIVLSVIPVFIWLAAQPLSFRFSNAGHIFLSIGQILGLAGITLFSLALILSSRIKFFDKIFYGINKAYVFHHNLGGMAFLLILLHPVFLAVNFFLVSPASPMYFLITNDLAIIAGEAAFLSATILLFVTFFVRLKYHIWKFSHKFLGLAFFFASIHIFLIPSDISQNIALKYYIWFFILLGYAAVLYRVVFHKFLVKRYSYKVDGVKQVSNDVVEIIMLPTNTGGGNKIDYTPGQFVFIGFDDDIIGREVHPFSITSAPFGGASGKLSIMAKDVGDYTSNLKLLKPGTAAKIEGPFGKFSYLNYPVNRKQIWIAGGIGITPFLSMARSLQNLQSAPFYPPAGGEGRGDYKIDLYYSAKDQSELLFEDEFKNTVERFANFKFFPFVSKEKGRITAEFILNLSESPILKRGLSDYKNYEIFICGPVLMMQSFKKQFIELGVTKNNIHTEEFKLY